MKDGDWFNPLSVFDDVKAFPGPWDPQAGKAHELAQVLDVIDRLKQYAEAVSRYAASCPGLKIASDFDLARPDVVGKNLAWLTSVALLKLPPVRFTVDSGDPEETRELEGKRETIAASFGRFSELHCEHILIPMPTIIEEYDGQWDRSFTTDFGKTIEASFSDASLARQMTELRADDLPPGVVELLLPRVAPLPLAEIVALRRDCAELFTRFQNELVMLLAKSAASDSEGKLLDLLRHVDGEVHRLRRELELVDRRKRLQALGLAYSFGVLSLVLVLPTDLFKSLAAVLGSSSVFRALENVRLIQTERRALEDDPFYIPYRLTTLADQYNRGGR